MNTNTAATITFGGRLSAKRFRDAIDMVKVLGGTYDADERSWTVALGDDYCGQQPKVFAAGDLKVLADMYGASVVTR